MIEFAPGWRLHVDDGLGWLFTRLAVSDDRAREAPLADAVAGLADARGLYRVVFELSDGLVLHSLVVGELVVLHKRLCLKGGALRLCAFSAYNYEVIRLMQLGDRFQNYADRRAAVEGREQRV